MLSIGVGAGNANRIVFQVEKAFDQLNEISIKLATFKRINKGSDDPAGLIAATELHREITALEEASAATERTQALARVADSGLAEASNLLNQIEGNVVAAANETLSHDERAAIQIEIDAAIEALGRIGNSTSFTGNRVFTGESRSVLIGPNPNDQALLTIPNLDSGSLGTDSGLLSDLRSGGSASVLSGNAETAASILGESRAQISSARAEIGSFVKYTIDATQRLFQDTIVNLRSGLSLVEDADIATESAKLARSLILAETSIATASLSFGLQSSSAAALL